MAVSDAQRRAAEDRLRYDTPFWTGGLEKVDGQWRETPFEGCAKIVNKRSELVRLIPRPWQLELDEALERQRAAGEPMRAIILKARQLGMSTWIAMKFLQRLTQLQYQRGVIVAQDVSTAGKIFKMAKLAYSHLPTEDALGLGFNIKPHLIHEGASENGRMHMIFGEPSRQARRDGATGESIIEIDTAQSPTSGRGGTTNLVHLSEVAFWEDKQGVAKMDAMFEAVPSLPETILILESTANGMNHYHRRWISAREGAADPLSGETYVPIFIPWWRDPECARKFSTEAERERFIESIGNTGDYGELAEDEPLLQSLYGCTPEQLFWRRSKIQTRPDKSVQGFNQENPHSDEVAFIGSGQTVFSGILVARAITAVSKAPEPVSGSLRVMEWEERRSRFSTVQVPVGVAWLPAAKVKHDDLLLEVWEHPRLALTAPQYQADGKPTTDFERRNGAYVVAADIAEGEANTFSEGDYHAVTVFDHHTRREVAKHVSRIDIHLLPLWLLMIAVYYNDARLAVEVNGPGIGVVDPLKKDYHYRRMYRRERIDDERTHQRSYKPGWKTDMVTKPAMEATYSGLLDSDLLTEGLIRDRRVARELQTYVVNDRGKHGAVSGEHDDRLLSAMIGQQVMVMKAPPKIGGKGERPERRRDPITGY